MEKIIFYSIIFKESLKTKGKLKSGVFSLFSLQNFKNMSDINAPLVKQFRFIGNLESISYVALIAIAMPLKYFADMPLAVRIVGSIHGFLFTVYMVYLLYVYYQLKLSFKQLVVGGIASLLPFGPHFLEKFILPQEKTN